MISPRWASRALKRGVVVVTEANELSGINSAPPPLRMKRKVNSQSQYTSFQETGKRAPE
jgi:hypothetical protein